MPGRVSSASRLFLAPPPARSWPSVFFRVLPPRKAKMRTRIILLVVLAACPVTVFACTDLSDGEQSLDEPVGSGAYEDVTTSHPLGLQEVGEFESPPGDPFWAIANLSVSSDNVFVLDARANLVHRYDTEGRHQATFGGEGQGPGELSAPVALGTVGDTLWILNSQNMRMDYFSTEGDYLNSQAFPAGVVLSDAVTDGEYFIGNQLVGELPLVRFRRESSGGNLESEPVFFGEELATAKAEYESDYPLTESPPVYRLALVGYDLWVVNYFHPIAAVYDRSGEMRRLVTYPDLGRYYGGSDTESEGDGGTERRPDAGSLFAYGHDSVVHFLSLQVDDQGRQQLFMVDIDTAEPIGRIASQLQVLLGPMVTANEDTVFAVAVRPDTEENTVMILEPAGE